MLKKDYLLSNDRKSFLLNIRTYSDKSMIFTTLRDRPCE